ncbi:MAG TPA: arsenate reductase ArsC [Conexibacter sp.]|nr:arsenate reductase ArsC [Conexibacter sp.]
MKYVLFVCTHNAGRSQMAQAFFEQMAPADVHAESAGTDPLPEIWPEVVRVMSEVGIELGDRRPKRLDVEMQRHADWAVTMGCGDACPYVPTHVEEWNVRDPAGLPLDVVRAIRDDIEQRVGQLLDDRLEQIRGDRTAHERRLAQLLPPLVQEFEASRSAEEIRACLDAVLDPFDEVPVRSHVGPLAMRRARACLALETCCPELVA